MPQLNYGTYLSISFYTILIISLIFFFSKSFIIPTFSKYSLFLNSILPLQSKKDLLFSFQDFFAIDYSFIYYNNNLQFSLTINPFSEDITENTSVEIFINKIC